MVNKIWHIVNPMLGAELCMTLFKHLGCEILLTVLLQEGIDLGSLGATFGEMMVEKRFAAKLRYFGSKSI